MKKLKQGIFLASWQRLTASGGNFSSKGRFFTGVDAIVNILSTKTARLSKEINNINLQRKTTTTKKKNREQQDLPKATLEMY